MKAKKPSQSDKQRACQLIVAGFSDDASVGKIVDQITDAMTERDVDAANDLLWKACNLLQEGAPLPVPLARYLAYSFFQITGGVDPAQALHLKRNARGHVSIDDQLRLCALIEQHRRSGRRGNALTVAAETMGLQRDAAEKRYASIQDHFASMISAKFRELAAANRSPQGLGDALLVKSPTSAADALLDEIIDHLAESRPKKGN